MTQFRLCDDGTFDVLDGRRVVFVRAFARLLFRDSQGIERIVRTTNKSGDAKLHGTAHGIEIVLDAMHDTLTLTCTNSTPAPISLDAFDVAYCDAAQAGAIRLGRVSDLLYLHHGWQSWSKTEIRPATAPEIPFDGDDFYEKHLPHGAAADNERTSSSFILVGHAGQDDATLVGFETSAHQFSQIRFCVSDDHIVNLRAVAHGDGARLDAGATIASERLTVTFGDANTLYQDYVQRVAKNMGRRGARSALQGWCSWYYYYGENTADDVRANLAAIRTQNIRLDIIVIDDGYQTAIGDWTSINADKFPGGMRELADEIHAAGKLAGIWLAPFGARGDSLLAQTHPEFFLRDESGVLVRAWSHWNESVYALDLTRPDVAAWLRELFHTVCFEWGYDAVKLDFVFAGALSGKHFDPHMTRAQAYRRGLEIIAETIGEEKIILGCGAPQFASVGLVDAMRVSQDVNFTWAPGDPANGGGVSTQHAVQNSLLRAPFNQHWWLNDPDCVIVRKYGDMNAMTRNENRSLASIAALTGSVLMDSDNLANIAPHYLQDLTRILPALKQTARVRQWFSRGTEQPSELELELGDGRWILAAINWRKRSCPTVIRLPDMKPYHIYDFWAKKYLGVHRKQVKIPKHAPHQTVVLHSIPVKRKGEQIKWSSHIGGARD